MQSFRSVIRGYVLEDLKRILPAREEFRVAGPVEWLSIWFWPLGKPEVLGVHSAHVQFPVKNTFGRFSGYYFFNGVIIPRLIHGLLFNGVAVPNYLCLPPKTSPYCVNSGDPKILINPCAELPDLIDLH
ncbi:hypothetical protein IW261DRAFT_1597817 [Armillaria novae-zelandiae]|uniref:Uncharacterized protein n=1 Tax=Armillaria novae-zelandiae TaxID=153914 RepID=A0AA39NRK9_9AGAR|nr:hypothetical protein IW261DRAFT_1597817 [Armillaria novae-zelandiae]